MQKNNNKIWLIPVALALFILSAANVFAQVMEIEVVGGGYRLKGPDILQFESVTAGFTQQEKEIYIGDLDPQNEKSGPSALSALDFLLIEDQNGGTPFDVAVSATALTISGTAVSIPNELDGSSGLMIKNSNGVAPEIVAHNVQTTLDGVSLNSATNDFVSMGEQQALFSSKGYAPGAWRIFPVFKTVIPAETAPGVYISTLTFTIV
jgi:hypothetical protein